MAQDIREMLKDAKSIPVLAFKSVEEAVNVCSILVDEGLTVLELTMRHPTALDALKAVKAALSDRAVVGMGTITNPEQLVDVINAGADFGVSPGLTPALADAVMESGLPFLPGIATVSEAMAARDAGFSTLKFFPAEQSGGAGFLKGLGAVLPDLKFCPTGGLGAGNASSYLALDNVICFGASAFTKRDGEGNITAEGIRAAVTEFQSKDLI